MTRGAAGEPRSSEDESRPAALLTLGARARARRCVFESAVSGELIIRLSAFPAMRAALDALPPKLYALSSTQPAEPVDLTSQALETRVEQVRRSAPLPEAPRTYRRKS